jgi:peptidoglycan/xylan/chitin deacetylase (PgdA/CDA1 family)
MSPKQSILKLAAITGLSALARAATAPQLRILCYHGLWVVGGRPYGNCLFMAPEQFEARMARLRRSGRPVLPLDEAVARLAAGDLPPAAVAITIDDGWASTRSHMLSVLERYQLPATLYATTWYSGRDLPVINVAVDYLLCAVGRSDARLPVTRRIEALPESERVEALRRFGRELGVGEAWLDRRQFHLLGPDELADVQRRGLDVQLHTHRHIDVGTLPGRLTGEVEENRAFIARATGAPPATHFCYPSGTWHPAAPALLAACGVRSATLVTEGINAPAANPYALRRFVDGPSVARIEFDAYLDGSLHYLSAARGLAAAARLEAPRRAAAASSMLLCAI